MIHGHGDDIHHNKIEINFSSNVYRSIDLLPLKTHLIGSLDAIRSYPEPDAASIKSLIANKKGVSQEHILITNGATEAIYLIAQAFRRKKTAILSPVFSEYHDACNIHKHEISHIFSLDNFPSECDLFWLCNPNNPTGEFYCQEQLQLLWKKYPKTIFVVDLSYEHFTKAGMSSESFNDQYPNVISLHSMTKHFTIPGLRLGYLMASKALIEKISFFAMPWSVNQLAIEAGKYLLTHEEQFKIDLPSLHYETCLFQNELKKLPFLKILPTSTHFFLIRLLGNKRASDLKQYLIDKKGILIRDAANFRGLDAFYFRVATQSRDENRALVKALQKWHERE